MHVQRCYVVHVANTLRQRPNAMLPEVEILFTFSKDKDSPINVRYFSKAAALRPQFPCVKATLTSFRGAECHKIEGIAWNCLVCREMGGVRSRCRSSSTVLFFFFSEFIVPRASPYVRHYMTCTYLQCSTE
ncbi:hypothetical protein NEOLEDRAFT_724524 [Neolentinus lepideus HHB14362 ss-1]|uniref:Uncharacterized protein n=1 Tax=Neolentinus lepideus HHB14362 ss-1 TaxID=1314782 RepID=A0A165Q3Q3_9AGAM|nr:hypothetical protein NEOLEDRAFT_724524 [Neolentinus lepideus HHB14362 ss-1]